LAAIFSPISNLFVKLGIIAGFTVVALGVAWWWIAPTTFYARNVGFFIDQPVPFSHQHHVSGLGLDCRFCHTSVEVSADAGMPPTYTCMTCHSQIWNNAAILAPVRNSLASGKPITWGVVNNVPDYVYFNHSIHIAKGVGCSSCHGPVDQMPLSYKESKLTMAFCLNCHRDPGPQLRPESEIFNTQWRRTKDTPSPQALLDHYHIGGRKLTDCSICHR